MDGGGFGAQPAAGGFGAQTTKTHWHCIHVALRYHFLAHHTASLRFTTGLKREDSVRGRTSSAPLPILE